jgi:hypothetical protein
MTTWFTQLEDAADASELVAVARDYLASWEAPDLALIPEEARPQRVKGIDDIAHWHNRLVDCYCTGAALGANCEKVRDMLQFFSFAVQRATEVDEQPRVTEREAAARLFSDRSVPRLFTSAMAGAPER